MGSLIPILILGTCFLNDPKNCTTDHWNFIKSRPGIIAYDLSRYKALEQEASRDLTGPLSEWQSCSTFLEDPLMNDAN